MKISMIGCGKLGGPCAEVIGEYYDVIGYDIKGVDTPIRMVDSIEDAVVGRDIIFIAVPTPHGDEYSGNRPITYMPPKDFDYSIVKSVLSEVTRWATRDTLVVLISTVLPGTIRKEFISLITNCRFIYNPYLIAGGSVKWDMVNPECLIIGTQDGSNTGDSQLLVDFYKPIMKNNPPINIGTWDEAECIKIFYNTFISMKIGFVNMIQDVAERSGNINVDRVTGALINATQRIISPKYLTAGMGDGGPCHPRDNIALRWLAKSLNLGYDLFHNIMTSRDIQARNIADRLMILSQQYNLPIIIHGRTYKPGVPHRDGSYSELIGYFLNEYDIEFEYCDPLSGDSIIPKPAIILMAHNPAITYYNTGVEITPHQFYFDIQPGSVILDMWRTLPDMKDITVIHYGNTRL